MTNEKNELTFMRCPSCRSLVPTGSVKCRMCGFAFETSDGDATNAARTSGRVRQRTVSKSREEILAALEQAELGGQREEAEATSSEGTGAEDYADSDSHGHFENGPESSTPVEAEPAHANGHHESEYEVQPEAEDHDNVEVSQDLPGHNEVVDQSDEAYDASPEPSEYKAAAGESVAEASDEHSYDVSHEVAYTSSGTDEGWQTEPTPAVPVALEQEGGDEIVDQIEESVAPELVAQQEIEPFHDVGDEIAEVKPEHQRAARPEATIPPKVQRENDAGFRLRNEDGDRRHGSSQAGHKGGKQMSQDSNREDNRPQHGNQQQGGRQQQGNRNNQGQQAGYEQGGGRNEQGRDRGRQNENRQQEGRQNDNRQRDRDNRRNEREQQHSGEANQPLKHRHDGSRGGRIEVRSPVSADALIGWLVRYDSPGGVSTELRGSKFFITREQIRVTDIVVADPSVSSPHCLVSSPGNGALIVQDLLSENGISLRRAGSNSFENLDESGSVQSGDTLRFGSAEFLVVLVP